MLPEEVVSELNFEERVWFENEESEAERKMQKHNLCFQRASKERHIGTVAK
jgi:hypothetical protein